MNKEINELLEIIAFRKQENKNWAFANGKRRADDMHMKRLNNTQKTLDAVKNKFKRNGCDDKNDDEPKPKPVPTPIPVPVPKKSQQDSEFSTKEKVAIGATGVVLVYVIGKKVLGVGLLGTPAAGVGVVLIVTP